MKNSCAGILYFKRLSTRSLSDLVPLYDLVIVSNNFLSCIFLYNTKNPISRNIPKIAQIIILKFGIISYPILLSYLSVQYI